jgi:GNAT superfamily N-acetyltransferase
MLEFVLASEGNELEVATVHVRSWQAAYRGLLPDDLLDHLRPEHRAGRYTFSRTSPDDPRTLLAVWDGSLCGFATIGPGRDSDLTRSIAELMALYLDPAWWGKKVGKALIGEARAQMGDLGYQESVLWVLAGNVRARRFYEQDGWSWDGCESDFVWEGFAAPQVRYRRSI